MGQPRYKVSISRENQPVHQMAEVSSTMTGDMLLNMIRTLIEIGENGDVSPWIEDLGGAFDPGNFKSITITRVDGRAG